MVQESGYLYTYYYGLSLVRVVENIPVVKNIAGMRM